MKRTWLVQLRKSRGLTQEQVAFYSHIDRGFYAQIESGKRDPSVQVAVNIAKVLGIHPRIFYVEDLRSSPLETNSQYSRTILAQCDLNLRYTWVHSSHMDMSHVINKRDDELGTEPAFMELMEMKRRVIADGKSTEQVVSFGNHNYLVRCEALYSPLDGTDIVGVLTAFTLIPDTRSPLNLNDIAHGHVLYLYNELNKYTENLSRFVFSNVKKNHHVFIVEKAKLFESVLDGLAELLSKDERERIHYCDSQWMYFGEGGYDPQTIKRKFWKHISPLLHQRMPICAWSHMDFNESVVCLEDVEIFEHSADKSVSILDALSVCAYSADQIPASLQITMLRHHRYFMTDKECVYSPLYSGDVQRGMFPSLSRHAKDV